jgi:hypothetical protein
MRTHSQQIQEIDDYKLTPTPGYVQVQLSLEEYVKIINSIKNKKQLLKD